MRYHKKVVLSAIAASFLVAHGGGGFMQLMSAMMIS